MPESKGAPEETGETDGIFYIDPADIELGPIRHAVLPDTLVARIRAFKGVLAEVETMTLEETIDHFQRDKFPEAQVAYWEAVAERYAAVTRKYPRLTLEEKKELFGRILSA